ncbi:unnamed protein product [Onchocerca flexuosa]|uniref:Transthyretin-like family protein n=1 Tax=Onchocerca flexuosa TaxID=387005 RepID=A0A183I7N5_9BILA|nr:unnamed protein product [Onchocerca flexuosa]
MKNEVSLLLLLLFSTITAFRPLKIGRKQSTAVKGVLTCNGKPAVNVKVKLYNDSQGIDPMLKLYHDCDVENAQCLKKFSILIPNDFVSEGLEPKKTFDMGTLNLGGKFFDEERECAS